MTNTTKRQRVTPSPLSSSTKARQPHARQLSAEQKKDQQELLHTWELLSSLGRSLDARKMSERDGYSKTRAIQYLHGHTPLNTDAKLWFARELMLAPQEIWSSWEWPDITVCSPTLLNLQRRWGQLETSTRAAINQLISMNGTLGYSGQSIRILPGNPR